MHEIQDNPFRCLGVFANATLRERVAMKAQMKAFARVGQEVDNPLRLSHLLGSPNNEEEALREAESLLTLAEEREHYAAFWFVHGSRPDEDLEAIRLLDTGQTTQALSVWNRRNDPEALQNLMVAALVLEDWKQALVVAQRLYHHERNIRCFASTVAKGFHLKMKQLVEEITENQQWKAILIDMQIETSRKRIEDSLEEARKCVNSNTIEAVYEATEELDDLLLILGHEHVLYQTLAEQMANVLAQENWCYFGSDIKWLKKAYDIAIEEHTKARIQQSIYIYEAKRPRTFGSHISNNDEFGCGLVVFFVIAALMRMCSGSSYKPYQTPYKNMPKNYYHYNIPTTPTIPNVPTFPNSKKKDVDIPVSPQSNKLKLTEEELEIIMEVGNE